MSASDILQPDGPDYDAFLQAELGEDRNGVTVTVLSALARVGLEPWTEAKELACLAKEDAATRLSAHFEAMTDGPAVTLAGRNGAAELVSLLPKRALPVATKAPQMGSINLPQVSLFWVALALIGVAVVARFLYLAQSG